MSHLVRGTATYLSSSEVELRRQFEVPRCHDLRGLQPGTAPAEDSGIECLVVRQHRVRVHRVVDFATRVKPRPSELKDLGELEVDLIDPISEQCAGLHEV